MKTKRCDACDHTYPAYEEASGGRRVYSSSCPACSEVWEPVIVEGPTLVDRAKDKFFTLSEGLLPPVEHRREVSDVLFEAALNAFLGETVDAMGSDSNER